MSDCQDCVAARLRAKAEGNRNWRTAFACYECAAVEPDAWLREHRPEVLADEPTQQSDQLDLFGAAA